MSTGNITSIEPVMAGLIPIGVNVTFRCHGGESRTYFYNGVQVAAAIINGDDPSAYEGVQVAGGSGGANGIGSAIGGEEIGTAVADVGEIL